MFGKRVASHACHTIICRDGRRELWQATTRLLHDELGEEPFVATVWGGALGLRIMGVKGARGLFLRGTPPGVEEPRKFVVVNHLDCLAVSAYFGGIEPYSEQEIKVHTELLGQAVAILKEAFPAAQTGAYLLKSLNDFLPIENAR